MRKTIVSLLVLAATAVVAQADPLKVKIGAASSQGEVSFTLSVAPPQGSMLGGESVDVTAHINGATSAQNKVVAIANAVDNAGASGTWRAVSAVGSTSMTFEHLVGETWKAVDSITNLVDSTGAGTQIQTTSNAVDFKLEINPAAVAVGANAQGGPSFTTVAVTNTLTFTRANQPGDTAETVVSAFENFLLEQEAEGVTVERTSATSLKITLDATSTSALNLQVTDIGLLSNAAAGAVVNPGVAGQVVDR
jgi:hypothetical protein